MANNYQQSSSWLDIPVDKIEQAKEIVQRETLRLSKQEAAEMGDDDFAVYDAGCHASVIDEDEGVWLYHEESFNPESAETIARAVIEELELDGPFFCTWASTCDKPRLGEFNGGGFVVARGKKTYWIEASQAIEDKYNRNELESDETFQR